MKKIVVFSVQGCIKCTILKNRLKEAGIEFEEKNGMDNIREVRAMHPSVKSYPVVSVDGKLEEDHEKLFFQELF